MAQLTNLPVIDDLTCYRGDTWELKLEYTERHPETGVEQIRDMTGWTGRMQVRDTDDGPVRLEASTDNARMLLGPQDNGYGRTWQVWIRFAPANTRTLPGGFIGVYDIELTRPDGFRQTYRKGRFRVEGDVTRSET